MTDQPHGVAGPNPPDSTAKRCGPDCAPGSKLTRLRPWVQAGFTLVWLAPLGRWLHAIPGCVFHCYSCPLSLLACPIGVLANYAAIFPATLEIPYLLLGILLVVGISVGSLVCGWACPFGFLQDLLGRVRPRHLYLPGWTGWFRYVVLGGLVLLLPAVLGSMGMAYDKQAVSICRLCPAGALESGLPYSIQGLATGMNWLMSWYKSLILVVFLATAVFIHRPWCRVFCPLGGLLALFNRWSLFHLQYRKTECVECNLCRTRCPTGVQLEVQANVTGCIRCLECTTCGAIQPAFAWPEKRGQPTAPRG